MAMGKGRLEAFSDGVIAIIITIMVLEMKVPKGGGSDALLPLWPVFLSYVLSFTNVGIYWNNHHHLFLTVKQVNGSVLWANIHLLFWLSLFPFVTGWLGQNGLACLPVFVYGLVSFMSGIAYYVLAHCLVEEHGKHSPLAKAMGKDMKGIISVVIYAAGMAATFVSPWIGILSYVAVAFLWLVPDKRIERVLHTMEPGG